MKVLITFLVVVFSSLLAIQVNANEDVEALLSKRLNVLTVKTEKEFLGGQVRVYSGNRLLIISERIEKRRLSIDFSDVVGGTYTVCIVKGDQKLVYSFFKK